jgi:hypothetical protein
MRISGSLESASVQQFNMDFGRLDKLTLFESRDRAAPNAFLVRQYPGVALPTHFHHTSQFQVIAEGSGMLGRHEVRPFTVHYAGQESAYGPLAAGPDGLGYFTLRPLFEAGSYIMPGARPFMSPGIRRRSLTCEPTASMSAEQLIEVRAPSCTELIAPEEGGLAAWRLRVPAGQTLSLPRHPGGLGRFIVLTQGSVVDGSRLLPPLSVVWEGPDHHGSVAIEPAHESDLTPLQVGPTGVELLVLQFPANALDHTVPPQGKTQGRPVAQ